MCTSFHQTLAILNQWLLAGLVYLFSGVGEVDGPERRRRGDVALRVIVVYVVVWRKMEKRCVCTNNGP